MSYQMVIMEADDGTLIEVNIPTEMPSNERADYLRALYNEHVVHPSGHWKGRAAAVVPPELADDVADAMDFHGSVVDYRGTSSGIPWLVVDGKRSIQLTCPKGHVQLFSKGYWAHGF